MALGQILLASAAYTATGNTGNQAMPVNFKGGLFFINVTAVSGTSPALDMSLQALDPASGKWVTIATLTQITTAVDELTKIVYPNASGAIYQVLPNAFRWLYTIGGTTPSFTFSIGVTYLP